MKPTSYHVLSQTTGTLPILLSTNNVVVISGICLIAVVFVIMIDRAQNRYRFAHVFLVS